MKVAVGFDHAGFPLRQTVLAAIQATGAEVVDFGTTSSDPVDFPDYANKVGAAIQSANKMKGVYASICHDTYSAAQGVMHDDMNLLCLGGRVIGPELAASLIKAFLGARYLGGDPGGERLARRVGKIKRMEEFGKL
jgi:ribose 5-phosphate isomerase B